MPLLNSSSYHNPPWPLRCRHVQTILPSYLRPGEPVDYRREVFPTPDGDELLLDWSRVGGRDLLIVSHGLCGHSRRHYVLSLVKAFNAAGCDCLAWNYRGTGASPGKLLKFTTNNSTEELDWVTRHALEQGGYRRVFHCGYSMGGNLTALYFSREAQRLPEQVCGGAVFCATTDLVASNQSLDTPMGHIYARHFIHDLGRRLQELQRRFPGRIDLTDFRRIRTFTQFDDRYTAPICGFRDAMDYYVTASACRHYPKLRVPLLMVQPRNDPFLDGGCFPVEEARRNPNLYLELPAGGGHCGFISTGHRPWWPAMRALEFFHQVTGAEP